jgi:hypothetical protein
VDPKLESKQAAASSLAHINDGCLGRTTLNMFVRCLVTDLQEAGAASTAELIGRLSYMDIKLPRDDVIHVVEHARRRDLVAPLGHAQRADGSEVTEPEWHPTAAGLKLRAPLSKSEATDLGGRFVQWFVMPFWRTVKPVGLATAVGVAAGGLKLGRDDLVVLAIGIFLVLEVLVVTLNPVRTRLFDWLTLAGWPHYARTLEGCWEEYRELRSRRRWRAWLHLNHLWYWRFLGSRAALVNRAAAEHPPSAGRSVAEATAGRAG